ncbi:hypothetical protein ACIA5D_40300 [Actinoplanes sp. NPDC051513]|uniref:hypothetical protein n=1 Tax=Actinoplanes sp. NPDC051513 TaxID=3363908 RepID=UPI0037AAE87A
MRPAAELNRRFHGMFIAAAGSSPLAGALRGVTRAAVVHQNFHDYTADALKRSLNHRVEMVAAARPATATGPRRSCGPTSTTPAPR